MTGRSNPEPPIPPDARPCNEVVLASVWLVNVVAEVAGRVTVGARLPVRLVQGRYPAAFLGEDAVGSIASGALSRLVECLKAGQAFEAEVLELDGALVRVQVVAVVAA